MIGDAMLGLEKCFNVLVVDDCLDSAKLISTILANHSCEMDLAFDGQDAIPLLQTRRYDLIVLDWQMPKMGGEETLLLLDQVIPLKRPRHLPTPVLIYSSFDYREISMPVSNNFRYVGHIHKSHSFGSQARAIRNTLALL